MEPNVKRPTVADFANATFATHEADRFAVRSAPEAHYPWTVVMFGTTVSYPNSDEDMAEGGWEIAHLAPGTPEGAFAHFMALLHEPEGDTIPAGTPCVCVYASGAGVSVYPSGIEWDESSRDDDMRRYLFHPAPEPEWKGLADTIRGIDPNSNAEDLARTLWDTGFRINKDES